MSALTSALSLSAMQIHLVNLSLSLRCSLRVVMKTTTKSRKNFLDTMSLRKNLPRIVLARSHGSNQ